MRWAWGICSGGSRQIISPRRCGHPSPSSVYPLWFVLEIWNFIFIYDYYVRYGSGAFESFSELMASGDGQYYGYLFSYSNFDSPKLDGHDDEEDQQIFGAEEGDGTDFLGLLDASKSRKKEINFIITSKIVRTLAGIEPLFPKQLFLLFSYIFGTNIMCNGKHAQIISIPSWRVECIA